jgi:hypothetical protein
MNEFITKKLNRIIWLYQQNDLMEMINKNMLQMYLPVFYDEICLLGYSKILEKKNDCVIILELVITAVQIMGFFLSEHD